MSLAHTDNKRLVSGALVLFLIGAAVGRFSLPARVQIKTQEKIVEKEVVKWKTHYTKNEQKDKDTVIIETRYPDGTVKREKRIVDKGTVIVDRSGDGSKESSKETEKKTDESIEYSNHEWSLSGLAAIKKDTNGNPTLGVGFDYGAHVQRRILGPFYLGGFGLTDKTFGASIGVIW